MREAGHLAQHIDEDGRVWEDDGTVRIGDPNPIRHKGCTAAEWAELYERREAEYQQARSEADDALGRVAKLEADLDRLHHTPSAVEESLRSELRRAVGDRDQARDEAARLARQVRQGAQSPAAVETLSEVRHLFALAGELRGALAKFAGGR